MNLIKSNGITFGILLGLVSAAITAAIYTIDLHLFVSWWLGLCIIAVNAVLFVVALTTTKKQLGGIFTFKDAFTTYFIIAVIGLTFSNAFIYVLFNLVDVEAKAQLADITIEAATKMMSDFGAPQSAIDQAAADMQETDNYSLLNVAKGWVFSLLTYSVFGLLFALIFRSKPVQQ
jgi:hypothetical protein